MTPRTKLTAQEEAEINESVASDNLKQPDMAVVVAEKSRSLAKPTSGVNIEGLEEIPVSMMRLPYVRLVQPTSSNIQMADGRDAAAGSFYFNDSHKAVTNLEFVMLKAKHQMVQFERDGELQAPQPRVYILGSTRDTGELFILSLSATSFSNFGRFIARLKNDNIQQVWRFALTATSEKQENKKGKYYVARFEIGEELTEDELKAMEQKAINYGLALERAEEAEVEA